MRIVLTSFAFAGLLITLACHRQEPVPAEVQFVRDETKRFDQYTQLVNRIKEDQAAASSFIKRWDETVCKKRDQTLIAMGDHAGCGTPPVAVPAQAKQGEKK